MSAAERAIEIAFVNNMPDQALAATDMQFRRHVDAGARGRDIRWRRYFLPSVSRSDTARRYLARCYEPIEALYGRGADALIVTGAEPRAARFEDEPYWLELARLIDWAREHTVSAIWSCLAAHAAVYRLDGVARRRLPQKLSGVFELETTTKHWVEKEGGRRLLAPHSRYNDLAPEELERCGYNVSTFGAKVGVGSFWRREPSLFLFLQGHAEYDADSLMKEYRRDVLRFASGERGDFPELPDGVFSGPVEAQLAELRAGTLAGESSVEKRLADILAQQKHEAVWAADAARLYADWVAVTASESGALRDSA